MEDKKRPKPGPEDYLRFRELEQQMVPGEWDEEWVELYDAYDWSPELVKEGDKCGLKNLLGEIILPAEYDNFKLMDSAIVEKGDRIVAIKDGRWGVVIADGTGTWLVEPEFDYIGYPNDLTNVKKGDHWGVLNITNGEYLIPPHCEKVFENNGLIFINGIGYYQKEGKIGIITEDSDITEAIFDAVDPTPSGWVKVLCDERWGYIDENDQFTERPEDAAYSFDEN